MGRMAQGWAGAVVVGSVNHNTSYYYSSVCLLSTYQPPSADSVNPHCNQHDSIIILAGRKPWSENFSFVQDPHLGSGRLET